MKKLFLVVVKLALPVGLFSFLLWSVDVADYQAFWQQPKRWDLLILAQVVALLAVTLSMFRWQIFVQAFHIPFSTKEALRLGFLAYLLNFVSLGSVGGDLFKAILVARGKPERRPEAVASVLLDRAIGLLALVILAWISLLLFADDNMPALLVGIRRGAGTIATVSIIALLVNIYAGRWFEKLLTWIERLPWLGETLARMARAVRLLRSQPAVIPMTLAGSLFIHALLTYTVYLISHGVYRDAPSLSQHFMIVPPGMAAGALPLAPGGIGLQEGALAGLFRLLPDLPANFRGILVATVYRLLTLSIAGIGVVYYFASHGREFQFVRGDQVHHSAQE